jgi:CheY-like chemotaxis protein
LAAKAVEINRQQREIFAAQLHERRERTSGAPPSNLLAPVLVVEDDDDIADAVCTILEDAGHLTAHARDGLEGLERLRTLLPAPSLVLLDLMMPRMNGWEFYERMLRDPVFRSIPVILMTAIETNSNGLPMLRKPLSIDVLLATVTQHIGRIPRAEA